MTKSKYAFGALVVGLMAAVSGLGQTAHAVTRWVPDDYTSIQGAIQASANGDEVVVRAGTYVENLDYLGKGIVVRSESGPAVTIIDGSQPTNPDRGSCAYMDGNNQVLAGFSLTGGRGSKPFGSTGPLVGGGVTVLGIGVVRDNWIYENHVVGSYVHGGGGVYVHAQVLFQVMNNLIYRNSLTQTSGTFTGFGGGVAVRSADGLVSDNIIWENTVGNPGADSGKGGGIGTFALCDGTLRRNVVVCNHASIGGGIGGIFREITSNTVARNDANGIEGGANNAALFHNNDISENVGFGMSCPAGGVGSCNNFYGNSIDDPDCYGVGTDNNTANDPQYVGACDDICVAATSPLLPGNEELGCGQIGALTACQTSGIESSDVAALGSYEIAAFPNPMHGRTEFRFRSVNDAVADGAIDVYDLQGRLVRHLGVHSVGASDGYVSWDGKDESGRTLPSGSYLAMMRIGNEKTTTRVLVVR
ncbi:MAG: FlgD immunoglobulin-like domain containing protein [Candidatus Eisenbacteria bacterium]